ncbi:MAG TPA: hypothetical protein VMP01_25675 [Pirellulaceae bacterium]|nr:hypothetical protein [Pirellulaceae bacterium]
MSLLLSVLLKTACPSTHHKLAIDALRFLRGESADDWRDLFLRFHKPLLAGVKAPDEELKDFGNHVLYLGERPWGGATTAAREKFDQLVAALGERRWSDAAFAAGILSHYISEPLFPLNTRQSEAGNVVQPAIEWCVNRSYGQLQAILEDDLGGYPAVEVPDAADGIEQLLRSGAKMAASHYEPLLAHFDLGRVLLDPDEALDQESQDHLAVCLGAAVVAFARVLELAMEKSAAQPPRQEVSPSGLFASLKAPFRILSCHTYEQITQRHIEAMHEELELTGRVTQSLPEEPREIRRLYAEEVLRVPLAQLAAEEPAACGKEYGTGAAPRYRENRLRSGPAVVRPASRASQLAGAMIGQQAADHPTILKMTAQISRASPIEDAPLLTRRQAARLRATAIDTIGDLLAADPQFLAERLRLRGDEAQIIDQWKAAALQSCERPQLGGQQAESRSDLRLAMDRQLSAGSTFLRHRAA